MSEIVHNPDLMNCLMAYLLDNDENHNADNSKALQDQITKMLASGTVRDLIFVYITTGLQLARVHVGFNLAHNITKLRNILHLLYEKSDYVEKVLKQLIQYYVQCGPAMRTDPTLAAAAKPLLDHFIPPQ